MARTFSGHQHLELARQLRDHAQSIDDFRQALAVIIPLESAISLDETANIIGRSRAQTAKIRKRFFDTQNGVPSTYRRKSALRNRAHATLETEAKVLDEVLKNASEGGVVVIPRLKPLLEEKLGKKICLATVYNMLHRHNWRKIAPDRIHPQGDLQAQNDWKKNSSPSWTKSQNRSLTKRRFD